jgi:outer membrane protein OmpA-like peptidoglycan-associated protein
MLMKNQHIFFFAGIAATLLCGAAAAQVTPQLSVDQLTRALSCAGGTVSNGQCVTQGEGTAAPAAPAAADSPQALCEKDGTHVWDAANSDCLEKRGDTLGFSFVKPNATAPQQAQRATPERRPSAPTQVTVQRDLAANLLLTFQLDSANLTEQAIANARVFAQALKSPELQRARFEIQGHTDMSGSHEYNQDLSQRRAEAVRAFLISQGVDADRLTARGYSFDQLADPARPEAPENRRVVARRVQ